MQDQSGESWIELEMWRCWIGCHSIVSLLLFGGEDEDEDGVKNGEGSDLSYLSKKIISSKVREERTSWLHDISRQILSLTEAFLSNAHLDMLRRSPVPEFSPLLHVQIQVQI